jgi:diphthamide biosynthesis methyltransferase
MLCAAGLVLGDEKDITLRKLEAHVRRCDNVNLEADTSLLGPSLITKCSGVAMQRMSAFR